MTPDVRYLVEQSLQVRGSAATHALFARSLVDSPSYSEIDSIRRSMDKRGASPPPIASPKPGELARAGDATQDAWARMSAERGCRGLLRAQLITGQHNITDRARFAQACESVGLAA